MKSTERKPHSLRSVGYFQVLFVHAFSDAIVVSGSIAGEGRRAIEGARMESAYQDSSRMIINIVPSLYPPEQDRE